MVQSNTKKSLQRESSTKTLLTKQMGHSATINTNAYQVKTHQQACLKQQSRKTKS